MNDDAKTIRMEKAQSVLKFSDHAVVRAMEADIMGAEWLAWRERVREIVRNGGEDVPPEPPRLRAMEAPVPVEIPAFLLEPEVPEAVEEPAPNPVAEPEAILPEPESIPPELLDLVREDEAYGDTQTRLWELYLELNGKLMLGLATEEDARLHTRLHGHLAWISKGAAEVVT